MKYSTLKNVKSWIGHRIRELIVHFIWMLQPKSNKTVVIFPCGDKSLGSSNLRAFYIGKYLKKMGWRVTVVPKQLELLQRQRILRIQKPKVILIQKARHPLNKASLYPGIPIVFDIDDADYLDAYQYDAIVECCKLSKSVIAGSVAVAKWCSDFNSSVQVVWTGTPDSIVPHNSKQSSEREPIVAWACSTSIGYPEEAEFIKKVLEKLADRISFEFWLYGVDSEGNAEKLFGNLRNKGVTVRYYYYMLYKNFINTLGQVSVGLHPLLPKKNAFSGGKSFSKILAYLVANVAVVVSDAADHREFFEHGKNGMIVDEVDDWVESIYELLTDNELRQKLVDNANKDFYSNLTTEVASKKVEGILLGVIKK